MRVLHVVFVGLAVAYGSAAAFAQPVASPPAPAAGGVTAACKDGSTQTGASRRAACKGHGGSERKTAALPAAASESAPAVAPAPVVNAPSTPRPIAAPHAAAAARNSAPIVARTPEHPGDVWVNTGTKVYHCPADRAYGKTKAGEFMTEAAATAAGNRASHNKACS